MVRALRRPHGFSGQRLVILPQDIVRRCRRLPVVQDLYLWSIGSYPVAAHHYMERREGIGEAILIHCVEGRGWCRLGGRKWPLSEGRAIFIPPREPHAYAADPHAPWSINWIHFNGKRVPAYLEALGITAGQPLLNLCESPLLVQAFEELYGVQQRGYTEGNLLALSTTLGRYLGMFKTHQRAFYHKGRMAEEKILRSMAHMRAHLREQGCLKALAAQVHMSVPHYCSLFKRQTNASPILFLIRLKMHRACELLSSTDLSVATIGRDVGYSDPFYFCRIFKQTIGLPPTQYRRAVQI